MHQTVAEAASPSQAPRFHLRDYGVPSVADHLGPLAPVGEYVDVDARGRLAVMPVTLDGRGTQSPNLRATYRLVPSAGEPARDLPAPSRTDISSTMPWLLSFTADDRLLWRATGGEAALNYRITGLDGSDPVTVERTTDDLPGKVTYGHGVRDVWVEGGRVWFSAVTNDDLTDLQDQREYVSLFSFDPAHPEALRSERPQNALQIDVSDGEAVWIDQDSLHAVDLDTGDVRTVPVPVGPGCRIPAARSFVSGASPGTVSTNGHLVSLAEMCRGAWHLVVTDLDGRLVTDIASRDASDVIAQVRLSEDLVTWSGTRDQYVDNLTTGDLVRLASADRPVAYPRAAGRYVLWYDNRVGHVGEFTR
jgi:hypothetical protein